jgi:hypothetical protein
MVHEYAVEYDLHMQAERLERELAAIEPSSAARMRRARKPEAHAFHTWSAERAEPDG